MNKKVKTTDKIEPLYINKLQGRMLFMPSTNKKRKREILLIYGHHASLERSVGIAENLSQYGNITMPDLPGFGGMQSFYKIGEKPTLDNLADYLASFIKLRFKRKRITLVGISFGFIVITKMLQKYPELAKKVDLLISVVGFVHKDDFRFKRRNYLMMRWAASIFSRRLPAWFLRYVVYRPFLIRTVYRLVENSNPKLRGADPVEVKKRINFEIKLWHINDVRTYMDTTITMLTLDLCNAKVDLPVYHVAVEGDRYFDNRIVEQHMRIIYKDFKLIGAEMDGHAPTVVADAAAAAPFIPKEMRKLLSKV